MASKLLAKQGELAGKPKGDLALLTPHSGSKWGGDIIAPVSKGRQYESGGKHAAPKRG